jgi:hypothetical protein
VSDILAAAEQLLYPSGMRSPHSDVLLFTCGVDKGTAARYHSWQQLVTEVQGKLTDVSSTPQMRRQLGRIHPFPRTLNALVKTFEGLVNPHNAKFDILWGLVHLNLKVHFLLTSH